MSEPTNQDFTESREYEARRERLKDMSIRQIIDEIPDKDEKLFKKLLIDLVIEMGWDK